MYFILFCYALAPFVKLGMAGKRSILGSGSNWLLELGTCSTMESEKPVTGVRPQGLGRVTAAMKDGGRGPLATGPVECGGHKRYLSIR